MCARSIAVGFIGSLALGCAPASRDAADPSIGTSFTSAPGESGEDDADDSSSDDDDSGGTTGDASADASSSGDEPSEPYENIARVTITPGFSDHGDGTWAFTEPALAEVGHAFYAEHPDDYDFIVLYTEGDIVEIGAFAYSVQGGIGGIGWGGTAAPGLSPATVGSAGRLLQINVMNTPALYIPADDASIVVHETTHHWSAFIEVPGTPEPGYLLDDSWAHFNIHVHTGGPSATGYGDLVELGPGSFSFTVQYPLQLSPLELYLAGMIPPDQVPPMFYVVDAHAYDPAVPAYGGAWSRTSYSADAKFSGTRVDFTIDDVIAANGARTPAFGSAQTDFRFAFVLVCADAAACDPAALAGVEAQRVAFETQLGSATGGRASADATL